jgi:phage tail tube protein FII
LTTYHGVETKSYFQRLAAEGMMLKVYLGALSGAGVNQDFYTPMFPITDNAGAETDDETKVNVYTRVSTGLTWVELSDAGADFTIDGSEGKVTVLAAKNQAGDAGKLVSIDYYFQAEVGCGQSETITTGRETKEIHKLGTAAIQEIKKGKNKPVVIKVKNYYVNRTFYGKLLSETDFYKDLAALTHYLYPGGTASGQPRIKVANLVADGHDLSTSVDDVLVEDLTMKGITLTTDLVP